MTPADVFRARLDKLTAAVRAADDLDRVIVWPMEPKHPAEPERTIGGTRWVRPEWWPAGLPLPLTVGDALKVVEASAADLTRRTLARMERTVADLVPDRAMRDALPLAGLASAWPWMTADHGAPSAALGTVLKLARGVPELDRAIWVGARLSWGAARWSDEVYRARDLPRASDSHLDTGIELLYHVARVAWPDALAPGLDVLDELDELLRAPGAGEVFHLAIDRATRSADGTRDPLAEVDEGTAGRWAGELFALARGVAKALEAGPPVDAPIRNEGEARATAQLAAIALADALDRLGPEGRKRAAEVRTKAAERAADVDAGTLPPGALWRPWFRSPGGPARWIDMLARALWADVWRPERVRMTRPVALYRANARAVIDIVSAVDVSPGADGGAVLVNAKGKAVSRFDGPRLVTAVQAGTLDALALAGVGELASVTGARFVAWFAHQVQRRPNPSAPLVYVGGDGVNAWGTVAKMLGATNPDKDAPRVRALLWALHFSRIDYPDGRESGVLMVDFDPGSQNARGGRGKVSTLTITPGKPWLTDDAGYLPEGAEHRALAPIPALPGHSPPFVGDRRERGPIGRLYFRILSELAHGSTEIARGLGAFIPGARWAALAREEGVMRPPPLLVGLLQDRWTQDGDDAPAILERVGPDRWHLGPAFAAERELLEAGGKERIGASEGGKLSAAKRSEARVRLAEGGPGRRRRKPKGG